MRALGVMALLGLLAACGGDERGAAPVPTTTASSTTSSTILTAPAAPPATAAPTSTRVTSAPTTRRRRATTTRPPVTPATVIEIPYRVEVHTTDAATADFADVVDATLTDPRGWQRALFRIYRAPDAPYLIVIAEGPEVDQRCLPYDTYGKYSCQNGPTVNINADRWRSSDPKFTGDLATYRQMLINHEVGHLLGQKHPKPQCPKPGQPAPVMNQQSTELNGCFPNPWPLEWEIALAARHDRKIAPYKGE